MSSANQNEVASIMRIWTPPPFIASSRIRWALYIGALVYFTLVIGAVEVNWARMVLGLERGWAFVQGFMYPDFSSRWGDIQLGFQESLTMTVTSTALGVLLSIPMAVGASSAQTMAWGVVPQVAPTLAGISVFRWDINIRESTVLGLVGAGGIGVKLEGALATLAWPKVTMLLILILVTVVFSEWITAKVREKLI